MREIVILGSTGSIGVQALEIVAAHPDKFRVIAMSAGRKNPTLLMEQAKKFNVPIVGSMAPAPKVDGVTVIEGDASSIEIAAIPCDIVLNGITGSIGLGPTLSALSVGNKVALANKESLVAGGDLVMKYGSDKLIPVGELTEDQKDILKLRQIMGDTRIRAKLAEGGLSSYAKPISKNLQKAKDLIKKIKGIGSVAKFAGPVVAGISAAAEVLATPNVGEGETSEVNRQLKEEEMRRSMSPDQRQALQRIKDKSEEIAKKPVSPIDMIKEVGGAADINPKQAQLMQGEQDSPDIEDESSLNIENYEKLLKRKLGYK